MIPCYVNRIGNKLLNIYKMEWNKNSFQISRIKGINYIIKFNYELTWRCLWFQTDPSVWRNGHELCGWPDTWCPRSRWLGVRAGPCKSALLGCDISLRLSRATDKDHFVRHLSVCACPMVTRFGNHTLLSKLPQATYTRVFPEHFSFIRGLTTRHVS